MSYWDDCDEYWFGQEFGCKNKNAPEGVHIMNKDESKLLRRLMSENGMTEEEVRSHKKYRKMLSNAQKEGQKCHRSKNQKVKDGIMKEITKELKLPKEHPDVVERYNAKIKEIMSGKNIWNRYYLFH